MSITASALREIHRIHRQITDLRGQIERGPRQVKAAEHVLAQLDEACTHSKQTLTRTRITSDDRQLQLRQREDRIKDLKGKMNSCGSNREYQTFKEQIAADEKANSVLADEIFEALEQIDQLQVETTRQEADRERATAELASLRQSVSQQQTRLRAELKRVMDELHQSEAALPAEIKVEYDRVSRARGEEALAQVDNETCSGCYQMLSPQTMNCLMLGRAIFCRSCGALLYLKEDSSPTA